jgi:hypothetical protein
MVRRFYSGILFVMLTKRETHVPWARLPFPQMRDVHSERASPFNMWSHGLDV